MSLICSAEDVPDKLFATGSLSELDEHNARVLMADLNIKIVSSQLLVSTNIY